MHLPSFISRFKLQHLFFWILLFWIWYFLRYEDYSTGTKAFKVTLVKVIDLALMVSITNYILIPKLLYRKKFGWFIFWLFLLVVSSSVLKMNILGRMINSPQLYSLGANLKVRIYDNVIPHFFLVIAGAAIKLIMDYGELQKRIAGIAKEKAEAELSFLKSQINPHFLFNSLNTVYFLIEKENSAARNALHKFSEMLRYQLYEMNDDTIPIEKEVQYLQDYIDLQRLRNDDNFCVQFTNTPAVKNIFIEPLLLMPFVENSFKHISHYTNQVNFISVKLDFIDNQFIFQVKNSTDGTSVNSTQSHGIGLINVKKRLALLYPGKHKLDVNNIDGEFIIELHLQYNGK